MKKIGLNKETCIKLYVLSFDKLIEQQFLG
jgi:hypothetical protein